MMRIRLHLSLVLSFFCVFAVVNAQEKPVADKTINKMGFLAINSSANRAFNDLNGFDQKLSALLGPMDYNVVQPKIVLDSINTLTKGKTSTAQNAMTFMNDRTSASKLFSTLGLDSFLIVSVDGYNMQTIKTKAYVETTIQERTVSVSYKFLTAPGGAALFGGSVKATDKKAKDEFTTASESDYVQVLLDKAADAVIADLKSKKEAVATTMTKVPKDGVNNVEVDILVSVEGIVLPQIEKQKGGQYDLLPGKKSIATLAGVDIAWDGVTLGSASGKVKVPKGLGMLTLTKAGYEKWERMVNASEGQSINPTMKMTKETEDRLRAAIDYFVKMEDARLEKASKLKDDEWRREKDKMLAAGELAVLNGHAKMLEQSGFRVDWRVDRKSNVESKSNNVKIDD